MAFHRGRSVDLAAAMVVGLVLFAGISASAESIPTWFSEVDVRSLHLDGYGILFVVMPHSPKDENEDWLRSFPELLVWSLYNELADANISTHGMDRMGMVYVGKEASYQAWAENQAYTDFQHFLSQAWAGGSTSPVPIDNDRIGQLANALTQSGHKVLAGYDPNKRGFLGIGSGARLEILEEAKSLYALAIQFVPEDPAALDALIVVDGYIVARAQYEEADKIQREHKRAFETAVREGKENDRRVHGELLWTAYDLLTNSLHLYPDHEAAAKLRVDLGALLSRDFPRAGVPETLPIHLTEIAIGVPREGSESISIGRRTSQFEANPSAIVVEVVAFFPDEGTHPFTYVFENVGQRYELTTSFEAGAGRYRLSRLVRRNEVPLSDGTWKVTVKSPRGNAISADFIVKRAKTPEEIRQERIRAQFSVWDGAHHNLTRVIKDLMHNPRSFKHVETVYWDNGDYLVVTTRYRGTNAFGAVVTNSITAKVDLDGRVLEILSQGP